MKFPFHFIFLILLYYFARIDYCSAELNLPELIAFAEQQYTRLATTIPATGTFISTGNPLSTTWQSTGLSSWTAGFYAGSLWMLYKHTNNNKWRDLAITNQQGLSGRQFDTSTHDVGFVIMSSYGHGLELTGTQSYRNQIIQAASSLVGRFFKLSGVIRSWNNNHVDNVIEVKVIADNMMNLELLFKASQLTQEDYYQRIAISHAEKTMAEHFRPDGGTYHVVSFDEATGILKRKFTWQGYSDSSTWARGQAWIINGFTTCYKFTNDIRFLNASETAAAYFINHLPSDYIPIWDFNAPAENPRDTSAATIAVCAFLELYNLTKKSEYLDVSEKILESLVKSYRADGDPKYNIPAIIVNGTVFFREGNINTAITYGDYYFLKALDLYKSIHQ